MHEALGASRVRKPPCVIHVHDQLARDEAVGEGDDPRLAVHAAVGDGSLEIIAYRGFRNDFVEYFHIVKGGDAILVRRGVQERSAHLASDLRAGSLFTASPEILEVMLKADVAACQSTPIRSRNGGRVLGMISTHFREACAPEAAIESLEALVRPLAVALEQSLPA